MKSAGGLIGFTRKLTAGMQGGQDDLKRRFIRKFWMRINWDAPTIIAYAEGVRILKMNFNPTGMTGNSLVHGIIQNFSC